MFKETPVQTEPFYETNDIQLVNGCYYRITVAYKTQIKTKDSNFLFIDTSTYEYKNMQRFMSFMQDIMMQEALMFLRMRGSLSLALW